MSHLLYMYIGIPNDTIVYLLCRILELMYTYLLFFESTSDVVFSLGMSSFETDLFLFIAIWKNNNQPFINYFTGTCNTGMNNFTPSAKWFHFFYFSYLCILYFCILLEILVPTLAQLDCAISNCGYILIRLLYLMIIVVWFTEIYLQPLFVICNSSSN